MGYILAALVLLLILTGFKLPPRWRVDLPAFQAALAVVAYSAWSEDYLPFLGKPVEAGYFFMLGFWGIAGWIFKTRRLYLVRVISIYVAAGYLCFFAVNICNSPADALVDVVGVFCWAGSFALYCALMWRARFTLSRHLAAAWLAAVFDLMLYYFLAEVAGLDRVENEKIAPLIDYIDVYEGSLLALAVLIPVYSLPLLSVASPAPVVAQAKSDNIAGAVRRMAEKP